MDLSINSSRPNFGMALYIEDSADKVIKKQLVKASRKRINKFWSEVNRVKEEQKDNPNDIFVRSAKHRNALVAEVVDAEGELKDYKTSQGLLHRNGSTKFLKRAEDRANKTKDLNDELKNAPRRSEEYFDEADEAEELADEMQEGGGIIAHLKDAAEDAEDGLRL